MNQFCFPEFSGLVKKVIFISSGNFDHLFKIEVSEIFGEVFIEFFEFTGRGG